MVYAELEPLVRAQIHIALGIKFLVVRDKNTGRVLRVTEFLSTAVLATGEEVVEVYEKDPSVQVFADLMNRALGKPAEEMTVDAKVGPSSEEAIAILHERLRRARPLPTRFQRVPY